MNKEQEKILDGKREELIEHISGGDVTAEEINTLYDTLTGDVYRCYFCGQWFNEKVAEIHFRKMGEFPECVEQMIQKRKENHGNSSNTVH